MYLWCFCKKSDFTILWLCFEKNMGSTCFLVLLKVDPDSEWCTVLGVEFILRIIFFSQLHIAAACINGLCWQHYIFTRHVFQIDLVLSTDEHVFLEHFLYAHTQAVERLSDLSFIPKSFNPKVEEKKGKGRRSSEYKSTGVSVCIKWNSRICV